GAGPDQVAVLRRRRDREHGGVGLDAGLVARDRAARIAHRLRVVPREIGTDLAPAVAAVAGHPDVLRADVERGRIHWREHDRERPLEALGDVLRSVAHRVVGIWVDRLFLAGGTVQARDVDAI